MHMPYVAKSHDITQIIFLYLSQFTFPSIKIQFSKNCLKLWRNTSFDEENKQFIKKIFSSHNLR